MGSRQQQIKILSSLRMQNDSESSSSSQSSSQLLEKEIETKLVSSLLEPMVTSSEALGADWDLDAKIESQQSQSCSKEPMLQSIFNENNNSRSNEDSVIDFVTVQLVENAPNSLDTQVMNSEIPDLPPRLSQRGLSLADSSQQFVEAIALTQLQRWILLIFCSCCNVLVPIWITVDVKSQSLTRSGWRIFVMSILLIPFAMAEQRRTTTPQDKFKNLLKFEHLKKIYLSSLNYTIWLAFTILAVRLTARAHSFCLLRGKFFWITLGKFYRKHECHEGEVGGLLLVFIGMLLMFWDSFDLPVKQISNMRYVSFPWWRRISGDLFAICGCLILVFLEKKCQLPKGPRFSTLVIYYFLGSLNMMIYGYFLGGTEVSFHPQKGMLGLFTSTNFVGVFYVSIMLGVNLVIANVLVNHIFSQLIRNMSYCFEIVMALTIYHVLNIERVHTGTSMLGVCFYVPGMMMIAGGQGVVQKLEMKINSEIYTASQIKVPNGTQITEIILKPVHSQKTPSIKQFSNKADHQKKQESLFETFKEKED